MFTANGRALWVGASEQFKKLSDAIANSHDGDTIYVRAGTYVNDWATIDHDVRIVGVGGYAHLASTASIANGKAALITNADVVIENLEFSGAQVADRNGAGIRYQAGDLTIRHSYFHDNENGILGAANAAGHIVIADSEFARNGRGDGYTHGAYVGKVASLEVTGSYFHDTHVGSHLKSRAADNLIEDNRFIDGRGGTAGYSIDLPNGGHSVIRGNLLDQAATTSNRAIVHFGGEVTNPTGDLLIEDNVFTNDRAISTAVLNHTSLPVRIVDNHFDNITYIAEGGPTVQIGNLLGAVLDPDPLPSSGASDTGTVISADTVRLAVGMTDVTLTGRANVSATGNDAANEMIGNEVRNQLRGGAGNDTLWGGGGTDSLTGGEGSDLFVFKGVDERVTVTDFQPNSDKLDLSALLDDMGYGGTAPLAAGVVRLAAAGGGTVISVDADGPGGDAAVPLITLRAVTPGMLDAADFRF